jgi:PAS domain S-box-containing protein
MAQGRSPLPTLGGGDELAVIHQALHTTHRAVALQSEALQSQREVYRQMVESLAVGVINLRGGQATYMNAAGRRLLGLSDAEDALPVTLAPEIMAAVNKVISLGQSEPEQVLQKNAAGRDIWLEVSAYEFTDMRGEAVRVMLHDVSERLASERRREAVSQEIANASERQQRRIGQDLHDDICQRLAAVKMKMQEFEERLAEQAPVLMAEADEVVDRLTDAIQVTRSLARGLSPLDIEAGGIGVALSELVRSSRDLHSVECQLTLGESLPTVSQHVATQLYRIAQESINNAARHARASSIHVELNQLESGGLELRVSNDGRPFQHDQPEPGGGMGLPIMRYRVQSIGGTLHFDTTPPGATTAVRCTVTEPNLQR